MKRGRSYEWLPLWIDKWLMGSTRFELGPGERSVFIDLLVLGAKDDGYIRANEDMGYPHEYLARILNVPIELLEESISKCIEANKVEEIKDGIYHIVNWEEYRLSGGYKRAITLGIKPIPGSGETVSVSNETDTVLPSKYKYMSNSMSSISFNIIDNIWEGITDGDMKGWAEAYPACDINAEFLKMREWMLANPKKAKKSNYRRFIVNWLTKTQDQGGTKNGRAGNPCKEPDSPLVGANDRSVHTPDYWADVRRLKAEGKEGQALTDALAKQAKKEKV